MSRSRRRGKKQRGGAKGHRPARLKEPVSVRATASPELIGGYLPYRELVQKLDQG